MTRGEVGDRRPAPIRLHDGSIVVPAVLCGELAAALDLLVEVVRGTPPPAACRPARVPRAVLAVLIAARDGAVEYERQETLRDAVAASRARVAVLPRAQAAASSGQEITTAQAATILGVTEARIRQLAAAGAIGGRKTERAVWLLDPESVRAYRQKRRSPA